MEKKILIVLCIILLVEMSLIISEVDCRVLRTEHTNGFDRKTALDGCAFKLFSTKGNNSSDRRVLMKSLAFRLASGPSRRGRGH
ncbi:unnamed protein product [Cochlearia groenlandica]